MTRRPSDAELVKLLKTASILMPHKAERERFKVAHDALESSAPLVRDYRKDAEAYIEREHGEFSAAASAIRHFAAHLASLPPRSGPPSPDDEPCPECGGTNDYHRNNTSLGLNICSRFKSVHRGAAPRSEGEDWRANGRVIFIRERFYDKMREWANEFQRYNVASSTITERDRLFEELLDAVASCSRGARPGTAERE